VLLTIAQCRTGPRRSHLDECIPARTRAHFLQRLRQSPGPKDVLGLSSFTVCLVRRIP